MDRGTRYSTKFHPLHRTFNEFASLDRSSSSNVLSGAVPHKSTQLQTEVEEREPASSHIVRKPVPRSGSEEPFSHRVLPGSKDSAHHALPRSKHSGTAESKEAPSITNQSSSTANYRGSHTRSVSVSSAGSALLNQEVKMTHIMRPEKSARIIDIAPKIESQSTALAPARRPHRS